MEEETSQTVPGSIDDLERKMHFTGKVVKTTLAGAIVDIGMEVPGVVHISQLQTEPVKRLEDIVQVGQTVDVWIRRVYPKKKRIDLTMIKPLALEWYEIKKDMVVEGKVVRLEKFGVFVDIGAERPGLVHVSELTHGFIRTPQEVVKEGDEVEVKVLEVNPKKKQVRLSMKALEMKPEKPAKPKKGPTKEKIAQPEEAEKEEPTPTTMEAAMREAMERAQTDEGETEREKTKRRSQGSAEELDDILSRTLKNRVATK
jgi:small subunit ribosomal protein S1